MPDTTTSPWDDEVDLLVVGAGAGGMTAALVGSLEGLEVLLCEKTEMVGGITSTSGGTIWIPGTHLSVEAGVPDTTEAAASFLDAVVGERGGDAQRAAFLEAGPQVVEFLQSKTAVKLAAAQAHPDYIGNQPGEAYGGRALAPLPFDGRRLDKADFIRVRPPRREFLALGGMMTARNEIDALLHPLASLGNFRLAATTVLRYAFDRLRYPRGTRLVMGNALVAQLLYSLRQQDVPLRFETRLVELVKEGDAVVGAIMAGPDGHRRIWARHGVVLATGGIARHPRLRQQLYPEAARRYCLAPETNTGDGVEMALAGGAALTEGLDSPGLWMPCSILKRQDGTELMWPHIILDRAKPGLIAVNSAGRRFVNESDSYHDFVMGMLRSPEQAPDKPAHLICDRAFLDKYILGMVFHGSRRLKPFLKAGYLIEGESPQALAGKIGVDPAALEQTLADYNRDAERGEDPIFGRGTSAMNRFNGDPEQTPNPCVRPLGPGPYYALAVWPADLASSVGLKGDEDGRVLDADERPIHGLYACGNDLGSMFRGTYPGPGTTLGPAMVMAWRLVQHAADGEGRANARTSQRTAV
ncbi:FAD-binding dehydrogenase [Halomonas heilongjiangensis]|uniref:FAD-binding dehydrogenase n=2 Tax=Halomonas heilongjiangensis TaxID=1387883 RepID=A0A2N7TH68_9GAMM|nr:FAD-binding protein [Halomonas heilongjiangensis]PMR67508.1 FAD-binding dehydrogenase [Halomonas heilongjiangensis]PXX87049.1 FAD-binding dehydrogenase [Halomonas heilongjiangensis]